MHGQALHPRALLCLLWILACSSVPGPGSSWAQETATAPAPATADSTAHVRGLAQIEAVREDRPQLAGALESRPDLADWIAHRFAVNHPPVQWSPDPPISGRLAEFDARDSTLTFVRVDDSVSGIDQLANLVFELNNALGYAEFDAIHMRAVRGEIDREEYAVEMLAQEMVTLRRAREIYRQYFEELSAEERSEARTYYKLLYGPDTVEERVEMYLEKGFDLRDHFRQVYDDYVVPEMKSYSTTR